jgi:hypothetical protein
MSVSVSTVINPGPEDRQVTITASVQRTMTNFTFAAANGTVIGSERVRHGVTNQFARDPHMDGQVFEGRGQAMYVASSFCGMRVLSFFGGEAEISDTMKARSQVRRFARRVLRVQEQMAISRASEAIEQQSMTPAFA